MPTAPPKADLCFNIPKLNRVRSAWGEPAEAIPEKASEASSMTSIPNVFQNDAISSIS